MYIVPSHIHLFSCLSASAFIELFMNCSMNSWISDTHR